MKKLYALMVILALLLPVLAGCGRMPSVSNIGNGTQTTPSTPADPAIQNASPTASQKQLTREQARDIALQHAGLTASQVADLDVELDRDASTLHYDVAFEANSYDYEYEIDAVTGKILHTEKERN